MTGQEKTVGRADTRPPKYKEAYGHEFTTAFNKY